MRTTGEAVPANGVLETIYRLATPSPRRSDGRLFGSVGPAQSFPPLAPQRAGRRAPGTPPVRRRFAGLTCAFRFPSTAFVGASPVTASASGDHHI
jgi:hypothetical protein